MFKKSSWYLSLFVIWHSKVLFEKDWPNTICLLLEKTLNKWIGQTQIAFSKSAFLKSCFDKIDSQNNLFLAAWPNRLLVILGGSLLKRESERNTECLIFGVKCDTEPRSFWPRSHSNLVKVTSMLEWWKRAWAIAVRILYEIHLCFSKRTYCFYSF